MDIRILGPVEVYAAGRRADLGPPRQRTVLAALAVDAGRPVPMDTLVDRVWGAAPPTRARHALYAYIARLRSVLSTTGPDGADHCVLGRRSGGYVLDVDPEDVDAHRFERLAEQARDPRCGDGERLRRLRAAMALWRGPLLADLSGEWVERVREGWQRRRIDAALAWADAELRAGSARAAPVLTELVAEHPLVEPLAAALMRTLQVAGDRAAALSCFDTVSRQLAEQVGVVPGPELQRLHQAIVRPGAPDTGPPPAAPADRWPGPAGPVPQHLPLDPPGFTGRAAEISRLDAILAGAADRPAVAIATLSGAPGIGKTALAVHWAHRVAAGFPDGQLYVDLHGFHAAEPATDPAEAVHGFLDALGVPAGHMPVTPQGQVGLYRSLLAGRRMLLVLDNARDAEQVRPLLPGAPGCLVVVTSRAELPSLTSAEGARPVTLDLLSADEASQLLARRLGADRLAADPPAAAELVELCAGLPVALVIVASRAIARPDQLLARLAAELRASRSGLDAFTAGDTGTDLGAIFSWSYRLLSPPAARLFRLLGLSPGADLAAPAAASLAGLDPHGAGQLLAELTRAHLLTEAVDGRYGFHDLLRAYAVDLTRRLDTEPDRRAALLRVLDHYLHTAHHAARLLNECRDPLVLSAPVPGVSPGRVADAAAALSWFAAERHVLLAAVQRAADAGFDAHVWPLAWCLTDFFERQGRWQDWVTVQRAGLEAARRLADDRAEARAHRGLGRAYGRTGRDDEALDHLDQAQRLQARSGDRDGLGHTHLMLAWMAGHRGRLPDALRHAKSALRLFRATGHRAGMANALNSVGFSQAHLGEHEQALAACAQALTLLHALGDRAGEATTWDSLGFTHHCLGRHRVAVRCFRRALGIYRELADQYGEAETLTRLGDTHRALGDPTAAREAWQRAADLRAGLGDPDPADVRARLVTLDRPARQPAPH